MIVALLLLIINILIFINTKEPEKLTEVREKYRILREHLKETGNEKFEMLANSLNNKNGKLLIVISREFENVHTC